MKLTPYGIVIKNISGHNAFKTVDSHSAIKSTRKVVCLLIA